LLESIRLKGYPPTALLSTPEKVYKTLKDCAGAAKAVSQQLAASASQR
jgi:hypothetical protein